MRLGLQRQEEAKCRYEENGETPLPAALHVRQQQAIAAGGIAAAEAIRDRAVKQRDESNARAANANRTCKTALWMYGGRRCPTHIQHETSCTSVGSQLLVEGW